MESVKLYVGTYGKYNEGSIKGAWLDLADYDTFDEFIEACKQLHSDESDPELMFQDCDNLPMNYYCESNAEEAFNYQKAMEAVEARGYDAEALKAYMNIMSINNISDTDELIKGFEDLFIAQLEDDENSTVGYFAVENGLMGNIPSDLTFYIDYEMLGRDLLISDWSIDNGYLFNMAY